VDFGPAPRRVARAGPVLSGRALGVEGDRPVEVRQGQVELAEDLEQRLAGEARPSSRTASSESSTTPWGSVIDAMS